MREAASVAAKWGPTGCSRMKCALVFVVFHHYKLSLFSRGPAPRRGPSAASRARDGRCESRPACYAPEATVDVRAGLPAERGDRRSDRGRS